MVVLSFFVMFSMYYVELFDISFQLENVNKWASSQVMIRYAAKLRKILINYDEYYINTLFLGYVEIHQQKCDN